MERRGFLKGLFGGVAATGLIVAATPLEVETFAKAMPIGAPLAIDTPPRSDGFIGPGEHLYNSRGELVAIVSELTVARPPLEISRAGDSYRTFAPGFRDFEIHAIGIGEASWKDGGIVLRGAVSR